MIANTHSIAPPCDLEQYLKVSQVASEFNVHPMTVRRATASGALQCGRSVGGQRLIKRRWVYDWLGIRPEVEEKKKGILCVCRVSGRSQMSSLDKQKELTQAFARTKYPDDPIILSTRIMSGIILDGPEVLSILDHILNQDIKAIVITFNDRLCRAAIDLFRKLCSINNIVIHVIEGEEEESLEEQLQQDLIAYLTSYTNRISGNKNKKLRGVDIEPEHMELIFKDYKRGLSLAGLEKKYEHLRNSKGQSYSFNVIYKRIRQNLNALELAYGNTVSSDVVEFLKDRVKYCGDDQMVSYQTLYAAYVDYVKQSDGVPLSKPKFSEQLKTLGVLERRYINSHSKAVFRGMVLKG